MVKTTLDRDGIYTDQLMLYVDSKREAEKYADKLFDEGAEVLKGTGFKKTGDFIRAVCA